jgi:hypothetical protein
MTDDPRPEPLLLDPHARAGRTGYQLSVKTARSYRSEIRHRAGTTREDLPTTLELLAAAKALSVLLYDATEGDARLMVQMSDGEFYRPALVISSLL